MKITPEVATQCSLLAFRKDLSERARSRRALALACTQSTLDE